MAQMESSNYIYTLDEALTTVGFGKYHGLLLAYGGLGSIADSMEMMIISFIGTAVQSEWHLSPGQKSLISTAVFGGMLVGAPFWGTISDNYGRKNGILGMSTITAVAGLLSAFSPNYVSLIVLRSITGFGLGGCSIFNSWFLEFVPTPNRGFWMILFSAIWTIGTISEAVLAWIIMPNFSWRWLVALSSVPAFIVLIFYGIIPESPRFLCMRGRTDEARSILEKLASPNDIVALQSGTLVSDQNLDHDNDALMGTSENTALLSKRRDNRCNYGANSSLLSILFSSKLIKTNIILWFLYFGNTFSYYGVILLTSEISSDQRCMTVALHPQNSQNANLYIDVFVTSLAEVPGVILSAFIVDRLGRKLSMVIMFVVASVLLLPLLIHQNEILSTALLFGVRTFVSATFVIVCLYAPEVYPTNVRATSVGIAGGVGRIGGMICPFVAVVLVNDCHQTYAVILFQIMMLLCVLSVIFSPFETMGRNLDDILVVDVQ